MSTPSAESKRASPISPLKRNSPRRRAARTPRARPIGRRFTPFCPTRQPLPRPATLLGIVHSGPRDLPAAAPRSGGLRSTGPRHPPGTQPERHRRRHRCARPHRPPEMCNGLMIPILAFEHIYSFDRAALIEAIPKPPTRRPSPIRPSGRGIVRPDHAVPPTTPGRPMNIVH